MHNKCDIIKILLQYGVDVNQKDILGETAIFFACLNENKKSIKILLKYNADVLVINKED